MKTKLIIFIQRMARMLGVEIRRAAPTVPVAMTSNVLALTISDVLLRIVLGGGSPSDFVVVQIGANDGVTYDPIRPLVMRYNWRGVMVEPQPDVFKKLEENYRALPNIVCEQAAIAETDGTCSLYRFKPGAGIPDWAGCLASFSRSTLVNNFHNVKGEVESIAVPTLTFMSLLRKHGLQRVDFLQIDTEGFDGQVIKLVDFDFIKPTIIAFEHGFLSATERNDTFQLLHKNGYKITNCGTDTVAYLEPAEQSLVETNVWVEG